MICIYIYIYIYTHIHVCVYTHIYIYICIRISSFVRGRVKLSVCSPFRDFCSKTATRSFRRRVNMVGANMVLA